ncbi:MAG: hypothetical protein ACKVY0_28330 [Prosthecobacter sp.]|uniref:hypothetical protein n=1 Tax=Prosthecobacter sp. TaxID=1965333 RepID=UPI0038FF59AB
MIATKTKKMTKAKPRSVRRRLKPGISDDLVELEKNKRMGVEELMKLATLMRDAKDDQTASHYSDEFMKGFYGTK